jgi:hypothetical protein
MEKTGKCLIECGNGAGLRRRVLRGSTPLLLRTRLCPIPACRTLAGGIRLRDFRWSSPLSLLGRLLSSRLLLLLLFRGIPRNTMSGLRRVNGEPQINVPLVGDLVSLGWPWMNQRRGQMDSSHLTSYFCCPWGGHGPALRVSQRLYL